MFGISICEREKEGREGRKKEGREDGREEGRIINNQILLT